MFWMLTCPRASKSSKRRARVRLFHQCSHRQVVIPSASTVNFVLDPAVSEKRVSGRRSANSDRSRKRLSKYRVQCEAVLWREAGNFPSTAHGFQAKLPMSLEAFEWQKIASGGNIARPRLCVARRMETESFCMFRPTEGLKIEINFERRHGRTCLSGPPNRGLALLLLNFQAKFCRRCVTPLGGWEFAFIVHTGRSVWLVLSLSAEDIFVLMGFPLGEGTGY